MNRRWRDSDLVDGESAATWIDAGIGSFTKTTVGSLLPMGFDSYARVLHPASSTDHDGVQHSVRWGDAARVVGAVAHSAMEWGAISARTSPLKRIWTEGPSSSNFWRADEVEGLAEILRHHTTTENECFFAYWEGNTAFDGIPANTPKAVIGSLRYYVLRGPVSRASDEFHGMRAHLWWPLDETWCVASHFDFDSTFVGGSEECIDRVLHTRSLEAWPVTERQTITSDSDVFNT